MATNAKQRHACRSDNVDELCQIALWKLFRAYHYAADAGVDDWQFAVEIDELRELGLSNSEFRWLLAHRYAEHAEEITLPNHDRRRFRPPGNHTFRTRSCFVLTEAGLALVAERPAKTLCDRIAGHDPQTKLSAADNTSSAEQLNPQPQTPIYDVRQKELRIGPRVVKRFRWPAPNQEILLTVFEEEAWPLRIDDPLPQMPEQDPRRRLHDTIKCLNRNQTNRLIRFRGDGSGQGVTWELR